MKWEADRRIGIFGGSFDPPHVGHVSVARDVADALDLERLLWVPALRSPRKQEPIAQPRVRLEMARAAARVDPRFEVDDRELRRLPPSYTVETLEEVRVEYGVDVHLFLVLGIDQYRSLSRWRSPERIRELATLAVMDRGGEVLAQPLPGVVRVPVGRVDVSATEVRSRLAAGESVRGLVPELVAAIIDREGLYRRPAQAG